MALALQETRGKGQKRAEDLRTQIDQGHHFLTKTPFLTEPVEFAWPFPTLTTVLLIRVIFTVVVPVTHPGASDALAVVTVEVQRGAGRQRWVQEKGKVRQAGYTGPEILAPNPVVLIPIPGLLVD